jgi:hypothetical protein
MVRDLTGYSLRPRPPLLRAAPRRVESLTRRFLIGGLHPSCCVKTDLSDALTPGPADLEIAELFSGGSEGVFDAPHETVAKPSSFAISAARIGAPISRNRRCASRSSRSRVASSPRRHASSARSTWRNGS